MIIFNNITIVLSEETSSLTHTTILIIVIIELCFAFGVALACVLFSWNLMKSIRQTRDDDLHAMPQGDFPRVLSNSSVTSGNRPSTSVLSEPLTGTYNTFYRGRKNPFSNSDIASMGHSDEVFSDDEEDDLPLPVTSLFQSFFSYLRVK